MTRPRRSLLFMPGSNPRALEKARGLAADGLILDLEDSVAPGNRPDLIVRATAVVIGNVTTTQEAKFAVNVVK